MRRNIVSLLLFLFVSVTLQLSAGLCARAQTTPSPKTSPSPTPTPSLEREFFKNIVRDQKAIWTAPLHLNRADAKWMVPTGVGMMSLFTTDRLTGDEIAESDRQLNASKIISLPGSTYGVGAITATFYLVGRKKNNARARETGLLSAEAAIDSLIVVTSLKGITQRGRPQTGKERSEFFDGGDSFPSGHSIEAWTVATVIANEYHEHRIVQVAAYGIASAVSVARFTGHKHYLSDVLVGSALGYGIGQYVFHAHHRTNSSSANKDDTFGGESRWPAIVPRYNRGAREYGIGLTWNF